MSHSTYHTPTTITQMSPPWGGEACGLLHRRAAGGGSPSHKALDKLQNQEIWNVLSSCEPGKSPRRTSLTHCWPRRVCDPGKHRETWSDSIQLSSHAVWSGAAGPSRPAWRLAGDTRGLRPQVINTAGGQQVASGAHTGVPADKGLRNLKQGFVQMNKDEPGSCRRRGDRNRSGSGAVLTFVYPLSLQQEDHTLRCPLCNCR